MAGVNRVTLVGNLGADPELRYTQSGQAVCDLRLATNRRWTDRDGKARDETEWHRVVCWGKQAESCTEYLGKGSQVYVEGRLQTRKWEDRDGQQRYTTEVVAQAVQFLDRKGERQRSNEREPEQHDAPPPDDDDDCPF